LRRYTTSDPSVEALGVLLRDNPHGIGLIRDELTGFLRSLDKEGRECDEAFYLEAWNGNSPTFIYDRIGRGTVFIPSPCVSLLGAMQPGPLRAFLRRMARQEAADDGLIQRFQLLVWPDPLPEWQNVDRWPNADEKNAVYEVFKALDALRPVDVHATLDDDGGPPFLHFDSDAQALFDDWRATLEAKVRAPEESAMVESHLAKYRSLMPSLALLFHLVEAVKDGRPGPVSLEATRLAIAWCTYLEAHARRVYACVTEPDMEAAHALAERIKAGALPDPFTLRDVYRPGWAGLDDNERAGRAVAALEGFGWVQRVENRATGGAPREDVYIHPALPRRVSPNSAPPGPAEGDKTDKSAA
jgi:putative DNA primase/helicase